MPTRDATIESVEYQVILVQPGSRKVLTLEGNRLPRVSVPARTRPAHQLQKRIKATWNVDVIVLDFLALSQGFPCSVLVEVLSTEDPMELKAVAWTQIHASDLSEQQREQLASMLTGASNPHNPLSEIGWVDEAIAWMESSTGRKLASKGDIEQFNAGGGFALLRLHTTDDWDYWLKATGEPNNHEMSVTTYLSKLGTEYIPEVISTKPAWNAWLMSGEATHVPSPPIDAVESFRLLDDAVESMAALQIEVEGTSLDLLNAGAFDQGMEVFESHSSALFDYLEEVMSLPSLTNGSRLEKGRMRELRSIFEEVIRRMTDLDLPETIVHGNMTWSNIVRGRGHCQFIDWCETYLGNPLITFQHMLLLNAVGNLLTRTVIERILQQKYRDVWAMNHDPQWFEQGFVYMPLLAIASTLYGRGTWLNSSERNDPTRQAYARTLARHMDRAARMPELFEAL